MKKRMLAGLMAIVILLAPLQYVRAARSEALSPNIILLEGILSGNRQWVYDTLVVDDRSSNPMALLNGTSQISMAQKALNTYYGIDVDNETQAALYKGLVDVMIYGKGDWFYNLVDEAGELVAWIVGFFTGSDDLENRADDLIASADELGYERLLKSALTKSYTASTGETIANADASLLLLRQTKDTLDYLNTFISFVNSGMGGIVADARLSEFNSTYLNDYALPYYDATYKLLESLETLLQDPESNSDNQTLTTATAMLAEIAYLSALKPPANFDDFSYAGYLSENVIPEEIIYTYKAAGKTLSRASTVLDEYLTLSTLQQQKETLTGPITRMSSMTDDEDMEKALNHFAELLSDEFDQSILSPDYIFNYLRNNEVINKKVSKSVGKLLKKWSFLSDDALSGSVFANPVDVVSVAFWVADRAFGLDETCKKTYELLRLEDLIDLAEEQCKADVTAYRNNKTDANAKKALDDLQLLQRLRLYGENVAYGLAAAQTDRLLGQLFTGGEDLGAYWEEEYQRNVDTLMAASIVPPMGGITIPSGKSATIFYHEQGGFHYLRCGNLEYVDLPIRLAGGISLRGTLSANSPFSVGFISVDAESGAILSAIAGPIHVNELVSEKGTFSLQAHNNSQFCFETLDIQNCRYNSDNGQHIKTNDLILSGTLTGGTVEATGDVTGTAVLSSSSISDALILCGSGTQRLNGTLTTPVLQMTGAGPIVASGTTYVTDRIYGPDIQIRNDKNIIFSGSTVETGYYNAGLTVQNAQLDDVSFAGALMDLGGTTYSGQIHSSGVSLFGESSFDGSSMELSDSLFFSSDGRLGGEGGVIRLSGDGSAAGTAVLDHTLVLDGTSTQQFTGDLSAKRLILENTGIISVDDSLTAVEFFDAGSGQLTADSLICLGDTAEYVLGNAFGGSLSVQTLELEQPLSLGGDLILRENSHAALPQMTIEGTLRTHMGAGVSQCEVQAGGLEMTGDLTLADGASVTVLGTARMSGSLHSDTPLSITGDLLASSLVTDSTICLSGDLQNTGESYLAQLVLNGAAAQGISGDSFTVEDLSIENTSRSGVTISPTITVTHSYTNNGCPVTAEKILGSTGDLPLSEDRTYEGDLELTGGLSLSGCQMSVAGDLTVTGELSLEGAQLSVSGRLNVINGSLTIDKNSVVDMGEGVLTTCPLTLDGSLRCAGDLFLTAAEAAGTGELILGGDFASSDSLTVGSLICNGLTRQYLKAASIQTGQLTLDNPSGGGVVFQSAISCTGDYLPGSTAVFGETYLTKEAG